MSAALDDYRDRRGTRDVYTPCRQLALLLLVWGDGGMGPPFPFFLREAGLAVKK